MYRPRPAPQLKASMPFREMPLSSTSSIAGGHKVPREETVAPNHAARSARATFRGRAAV